MKFFYRNKLRDCLRETRPDCSREIALECGAHFAMRMRPRRKLIEIRNDEGIDNFSAKVSQVCYGFLDERGHIRVRRFGTESLSQDAKAFAFRQSFKKAA